MILPFDPEPTSDLRSISNSLASLLTPGDAKTLSPVLVSWGSGFFSVWILMSFWAFLFSLSFFVSTFSAGSSSISIFNKRSFVCTLSPALTHISDIVPLNSEGISMEALSDSRTKRTSSLDTTSPTAMGTSLTDAPSIPSPRSGSLTSFIISYP